MRAQRWRRLRVLVTIIVAAAAPVVSSLFPDGSDVLAAAASTWLLLSRLVLDPVEMRHRLKGALLTERFERRVLDLTDADTAGSLGKVSPEEAEASTAAYIQRETARARHWYSRWWIRFRTLGRVRMAPGQEPFSPLRDWFEPVSGVPEPVAVILCQRGSAEYGRRLNMEWGTIVGSLAVLLGLGYLSLGLVWGLSLGQFLVELWLPVVPALLDAGDLAALHRAGARQRAAAVGRADEAWRDFLRSGTVPPSLPRELEEAALEWRSRTPGVPLMFYEFRKMGLDRDAASAARFFADEPSNALRGT